MIHFIKKIIAVDDHAVICLFNTNEERKIDIKKVLGNSIDSPFYAALLSPEFFKSVKLDSYGTLTWNDQFDFCPDVLYQHSVPAK